jgi:diguanylate cyclase (GGDEF)-like protein/PAS domain S-box-containing protein
MKKTLDDTGKFLKAIVDSLADPVTVIGNDFRIKWMNRAAREIMPKDYDGQFCYQLHHGRKSPCSEEEHLCPLKMLSESVEPQTVVHEHITSDGQRRFFEIMCTPLIDKAGLVEGIIEVQRDITERRRVEEELRSLSLTDELTALSNRRGFFNLVEQLLKMAKRMNTVIYMLYADLDGLKSINDVYGHHVGDTILKDVAHILKTTYRESDIVARIGGDEFVVIPVGTSEEDVASILRRLDMNIENYYAKVSRRCKASISVGITSFDPQRPCTIEELLSRADKLMYEQKSQKQRARVSS